MPNYSKSSRIASFDLYDTIVMRRSLSTRALYDAVWLSLSTRGLELPDRTAFVKMRMQADTNSKYIDAPTLRQILEHLDSTLQSIAAEVEIVEIEVELEQLRVVPGGIRQVLRARNEGYKIAFISDMHIGALHLEPRLRALGLLRDDDLLLVSSDQAASKSRSGGLFKYFLSSNNISAESVTHFGNNAWSDVKMATKFGISGRLCPSANLNRFESLLVDRSEHCSSLELMASVSRDVRLEFGCSAAKPINEIDLEEESLSVIASSVASPVLVAFVLWVINRCQSESISTIRFLTRDGELPYLIAKALPSELTKGLDLGMLEVSRRSLLLPAASVVPLDDWLEVGLKPGSFLIQQYDRLPARVVISRVGLTFEKHADLLNQFDIVNPEIPLGKDGLSNWRRALQDDSVKHEIQMESGKRLPATNEYLRQNLIDLADDRTALVDIGWTGQQSAMLSALIRNLGGQDPLHLHVGRLRNHPLIVQADIEGWLFDERMKRSSPVENPVALFETFCVTTTGGVEGYELKADGSSLAIRRTQDHRSTLISWGQPIVRQCILKYAELAGASMQEIETELLRDACIGLLHEFWEHPRICEALKWGAFPYEQDQAGKTVRQLANPYNLSQLKSRFGNSYSGIDWKAGSIALSPSPIRQILKIRELYRRT